MNREQARQLLDYCETSHLDADCRQLGNHEWVVVLEHDTYHLWGFADLSAYLHQAKAQRKQRRRLARERVSDRV
jgi:hypothetical protein